MHICFRLAVSSQKLTKQKNQHTHISLPRVSTLIFYKGSTTIVKMKGQAASSKPWVRCKVAAALTL